MSIWNKILLPLIAVVSLVFFFLAARALKTHEYWRSQAYAYGHAVRVRQAYSEACENGGEVETLKQMAEQAEADVATVERDCRLKKEVRDRIEDREKKLRELRDKPTETPQSLGVRKVRVELHKITIDRGRVWRNCQPQDVKPDNPQTPEDEVEISLETDWPEPNMLVPKMVLYLFEEREVEEGGRYLGQFVVTNVADKLVQLKPSTKLSQDEYQRLATSRQESQASQKDGESWGWSLYEVMPIDAHGVVVDLSDKEKEALGARVDEYLMDGKITTTDEVARLGLRGRVVQVDEKGKVVRGPDGTEVEVPDGPGMYVRQLRDYEVLFRDFLRLRSERKDQFEAETRDKQYLESALADASKQEQFRQKERDDLKVELAETSQRRDDVLAHLDAVRSKLAALEQAVEQIIQTNRKIAAEIARIQAEATRIIDERTRGVAAVSGVR